MNTPSNLHRPLVLAALAAVLTIGACAGGAAPAPSSSPSSPPSASPAPSAPGGGGSSPGDQGRSSVSRAIRDRSIPAPASRKFVIPKPGQLNPRIPPASSLEASVDGKRVLVKVRWTSGVEPCYVLDSVKVVRVATDIAITLVEGSSDANAICIEIAMRRRRSSISASSSPGPTRSARPAAMPSRSRHRQLNAVRPGGHHRTN